VRRQQVGALTRISIAKKENENLALEVTRCPTPLLEVQIFKYYTPVKGIFPPTAIHAVC
jgi:hypothetical protein